jgi:hypothetical protein
MPCSALKRRCGQAAKATNSMSWQSSSSRPLVLNPSRLPLPLPFSRSDGKVGFVRRPGTWAGGLRTARQRCIYPALKRRNGSGLEVEVSRVWAILALAGRSAATMLVSPGQRRAGPTRHSRERVCSGCYVTFHLHSSFPYPNIS